MIDLAVVLGAPGSGKGTQCKVLSSRNPTWKHISTGDLFRAEIASGSKQGKDLKEILDSGRLVPDEVTMGVFESQVNALIGREKVEVLLLDGCIRTEPQAEFLAGMFKRRAMEFKAPKVVELVVPEEKLVHRLTGRLINPRTGRIYHRVDNPPKRLGICDDDGGSLIVRNDDKEEVIRKRFQIYSSERSAIIARLGGVSGIKKVNGDQSTEAVTRELAQAIVG